MTEDQIIFDTMALPLAERVSLTQVVWQSIDAGLTETYEAAAVKDAIGRDQELSAGKVIRRTMKRSWKRRALKASM